MNADSQSSNGGHGRCAAGRPRPSASEVARVATIVLFLLPALAGGLSSCRSAAPHAAAHYPTRVARTLPPNAVDVRDYGARGNGAADDRPAIQRAVDACARAGGGTVFLPAGDYWLDSGVVPTGVNAFFAVVLGNGVRLVGEGRGRTVLHSSRKGLNLIGATHAFGVAVENLTLAGGDQDGVKIEGSTGVLVRNVEASGLYIGIAHYGCTGVRVVDCVSHDNEAFGFCFGGQPDFPGGSDLSWKNCDAYANSEGFRVFSTTGSMPMTTEVTLDDCTSHDNVKSGMLATSVSRLALRYGFFVDNPIAGIMVVDTHDSVIDRAVATGNHGYGDVFVAPWPTTDWWGSYGPCSNVEVIPWLFDSGFGVVPQ